MLLCGGQQAGLGSRCCCCCCCGSVGWVRPIFNEIPRAHFKQIFPVSVWQNLPEVGAHENGKICLKWLVQADLTRSYQSAMISIEHLEAQLFDWKGTSLLLQADFLLNIALVGGFGLQFAIRFVFACN